ncbi:hypothetical protein [Catenuloplanes indicus]|uniref:Uncharacterized protein n=1 Tax=Catenuloplanes indicus TaxID=137267 RepID=A0AAE3VU90_9ACTN|nr:hypothetical protein [Catenuloplanes indicus]MDQ0363382.1 hypothetical protein [Catenuloplanes indicus]
MSAETDRTDIAEQLKAQFGGAWTQWPGDDAGIPGATLWTQHQPDEHGRPVITGMLLLTDRVTTDALRKIPASALEDALAGVGTSKQAEDLAALPPLERGSLSKGEFLTLVAEHFKTWSRYSPKPSRDMARASGHPENTIYSWIREARLAGLLPPARGMKTTSARGSAPTTHQTDGDIFVVTGWRDEAQRGIEHIEASLGAEQSSERSASDADAEGPSA